MANEAGLLNNGNEAEVFVGLFSSTKISPFKWDVRTDLFQSFG